MARITIIANPHSKLNKQNPKLLLQLKGIVDAFSERNTANTVRLYKTQSLEELDKLAHALLQEGVDILAILGGDGTISQTISAFHRQAQRQGAENLKFPSIYLLGGGTINMILGNLVLKKDPVPIRLRRLLESDPSALRTQHLSTLMVNGQVGFLFASGTSARFLREFYKNKTNALGSILLVLKLYFSFFSNQRLYKQIVKNDNIFLSTPEFKNEKTSTCGLFCSTVEKMPLGVPLFPHAKNPSQMIACLTVTTPPEELPWKMPMDLILNARKQTPAKKPFTCSRLIIQSEVPLDFTLDGELFAPEKELTISQGPQLNFLHC